jgi:hypothetical protein
MVPFPISPQASIDRDRRVPATARPGAQRFLFSTGQQRSNLIAASLAETDNCNPTDRENPENVGESVDKIATDLGLNLSQLKEDKDMESPEVKASIMQNSALAEFARHRDYSHFVVGKEVAQERCLKKR